MRTIGPATGVVLTLILKPKSMNVLLVIFFSILFPAFSQGQAVTSIITDYNGWFTTSAASPNPLKPSNNHNLLAFGYNGVQYSTGANDQLLNSMGESFSAQDFWSLPVAGLTGTVNGNTKVGVGQMYDGVHAGASNPPPENNIALYLTDGTKGLNIGTCIANLPAGAMTFYVNNINPASIGDGIPDILVTQIADPSGSYDRYEFVDANNVRIGNYKDIIFTNITPVGTWTADFYEASTNPMILAVGFTNTDRPIRLWAADLSEFGITTSNYQDANMFKINLSGNSDVAFAAYNNKSIQIANALPVRLSEFNGKVENDRIALEWITQTEFENESFTIERSNDNFTFNEIGTIGGSGTSSIMHRYSFNDLHPSEGNNYYRLKMKSARDVVTYSHVILLKMEEGNKISIYPNPASSFVIVNHGASQGIQNIRIANASGAILLTRRVAPNSPQTRIETQSLTSGIYFILWDAGGPTVSQSVIIRN